MKILIGLIAVVACGQQSQLTLQQNPPAGVTGVSARVVGNNGTNVFNYWVVATMPIGDTSPSPAVVVRNAPTPTASNNIVLTWNTVANATTYAVLKTTTSTLPNPCTCLLASGLTAATYTDVGGTLTSYTQAPVSGATGVIALDNSGYIVPRFLTNRPTNSTLFAQLPLATAAVGLTYLVTDSSTSGTCTAGGGTNTPALCWSNGNAWQSLGSGGGAQGPIGPTGPAGATGPPGPAGVIGGGALVNGNFPIATGTTTIGDSGLSPTSFQLAGTTTVSPPPASQGNGDFWVVRTTPTRLTIGSNCTVAFPCKIAFGSTIYSLTAPATATIAATTDVAYIYVSGSQVLTVGTTSQVVTCAGCTAVTGISAFPASSFPLWNWSSTAGVWDVSGGTDNRTIVQKGADPLGTYVITSANTQLSNSVNLGALATGYIKATVSGGIATLTTLPTTFSCQPGLGDGLNAMAAGTYLQSGCFNMYGATYTITGIRCFTDNAGTSTLNVTNGAGTALLTGAITCNATFPGNAGTQSGTTTIAANDGIKFTFVSDGASKQVTWVVTGTR